MEVAFLIVAVLVIACASKLLLFTKKHLTRWLILRKVPGPPDIPYPLIGHAMLLRGNPDELYETVVSMVNKDVIAKGLEAGLVWIGPVPVVFLVGAEAAEVLLRSSKHITKSFFYTFLHSWLGTGLLTADGEKWKVRRRLLTPTFHFSILQDFLEVMNEQSLVFARTLQKYSESGKTFNVSKPVTLCALDIICETAMGKSIGAQGNEHSEYVAALYRSSELIQDRQKSPWLWWEFGFSHTQRGKEYEGILKTLHDFTKGVIRDRMKSFSSDGKSPTKKKRLAFLDLLLSVSDDGKVLSFEDIQEEVDTFMFEGHDTTAAAMSWAIHLIGCHPDVQRRIQEELDEVLGEDPEKKISSDDVRKLNYLEMVIKESLRMFPSVPFMGRTTTCDCVMDGHVIPEGTECLLLPQIVNRNPKYWTDPDKFDPERFTSDNSVGRHPYAYLPFSAGPRNCIGQRFALMEEKVMLGYLLREYSVESVDKTEDLRLMGDIILRPGDGINVKVTKRRKKCDASVA